MNASRPEHTLKPAQRIALLALASGESPELVAARARVNIRTLFRWRRNPAFKQALAAALDNFHGHFPQEEAAARIQAFQALADIARWAPPADRIRAASTLLKYLDRPKTSQESPQKPPDTLPSIT